MAAFPRKRKEPPTPVAASPKDEDDIIPVADASPPTSHDDELLISSSSKEDHPLFAKAASAYHNRVSVNAVRDLNGVPSQIFCLSISGCVVDAASSSYVTSIIFPLEQFVCAKINTAIRVDTKLSELVEISIFLANVSFVHTLRMRAAVAGLVLKTLHSKAGDKSLIAWRTNLACTHPLIPYIYVGAIRYIASATVWRATSADGIASFPFQVAIAGMPKQDKYYSGLMLHFKPMPGHPSLKSIVLSTTGQFTREQFLNLVLHISESAVHHMS
jgi:hypothetical protein